MPADVLGPAEAASMPADVLGPAEAASIPDLRAHIGAGDGVWWGQAGAEPTPLVDALLDQVGGIGPIRAFCGLSFHRGLRELPPELTMVSYGAMGELRRSPRLEIVPAHYSALPRLFAERLLPGDVGLVQVSPPGPDGRCSLGIGVDYAADAHPHSRTLIAEINHRMPVTAGTPGIPFDRFAAVVETDRPLPPAPYRAPDDVDEAIAAHVAGLVEDGDTIQPGVGALPTAILDGLSGHQDLGVHTGMITDGVLRLVDKGVVTGRRKEIDPGVVVTGTAIGSAELYARLRSRGRPGDIPVDTAARSPPPAPTSTPSSPSTASHTCEAARSPNGRRASWRSPLPSTATHS